MLFFNINCVFTVCVLCLFIVLQSVIVAFPCHAHLRSDILSLMMHSGKSATIRESNHGSGVCKEHYA